MNTKLVGWTASAHASLNSIARIAWATSCPPYGTATHVHASFRRATVVLACLTASLSAAATPESDPLVPPISPYLTFAGVVDSWKDEKREGVVRVAVLNLGGEHVISRVWLQWIEQGGDDPSGNSIVATTEIRELGRWVAIAPPTLPKTAKSTTSLVGTHTFANCDFVFQFQATSIGKYVGKFVRSPARNTRSCAFKNGKIVFE